MLCPYCRRRLSPWRSSCRVCRRFVWRVPHTIFYAIVGLAAFVGLIWFVEFLATRR